MSLQMKKICKICFWRFICILPCEEVSEILESIELEMEKENLSPVMNDDCHGNLP